MFLSFLETLNRKSDELVDHVRWNFESTDTIDAMLNRKFKDIIALKPQSYNY